MASRRLNGSKRPLLSLALSVFFLLPTIWLHAQVGLRLPRPVQPFAPLTYSSQAPVYSVGDSLSSLPVRYPLSFKHKLAIDSTSQYVYATHQFHSWNVRYPRQLTLGEYLRERTLTENEKQWRDYMSTHVTPVSTRRTGQGITISTPKIRSEAFRRVFGGDNLSLNVRGQITIDGSLRHEKRSQVKTAINRAPNTNFQMKQTQKFTVEGKIGENVSVFVDQDSERPFDFENAFKLNYSSDEDGIIKSIQAGNVALSLPSTRFVTFSAQNSGLFGLKTELKVGRLDITAIASMEKGQKKKLSLSGGKEESSYEINDYDYKKATYFFLDTLYRSNYSNLYDKESGLHGYNPQYYIKEIELYKSDYNYQNKADAIPGWAVLNPVQADTTYNDQENYKGDFIRLDPSSYYVNRELGFIVMNMPIQESEVLAVAYRDSNNIDYGTLLGDTTLVHDGYIFKLLKPRNPRPADETWKLEWKNVYSLGGSNIDREGFELKLYFRPPSGDPQDALEVNGETRGYLNIFGLDNINENGDPTPDNVIDIDPNIISLSRGEIIFPFLQPFNPVGEDSDLPEDKWTRAIYDTTNVSYIRQQSKFYMEVNSSRRSPNYSLGMNVIEGSEDVRLNGAKLEKDKDYTIDYFSGTLTILNEAATSPSANLEIDYESQQMFSVDKKSLIGTRAEYTLWERGSQRSFIGGTLLYMNQKTLDQRIRVGKDAPMRNLVWDVNTSLKFQPNFITKALDGLPFLNVMGNTDISFEGEVAQVIPNPNTLNNKKTGDVDGVAYLDDFEGAKRQIQLGVIRAAWGPASPPGRSTEVISSFRRKGHLAWYNPYLQVPIQEIWPDREVTTNFGGTTHTHVLTMDFWANDTTEAFTSWGGVQRALSSAYADQTDSRFLEVWVQGTTGRLNIDLGYISEDVIPNTDATGNVLNSKMDTEDKRRGGFLNNLLDEDEDTGLDGMFGNDPPMTMAADSSLNIHPHEAAVLGADGTATPYDFWDLNGDGIKQSFEPWSYDDFNYVQQGPYYTFGQDPTFYNGTENNKSAGTAIYPDTEDINRNGDVDRNNDYFEFSFNLDPAHADTVLIAGGKGNQYGWRLYRIPLNMPTKVVGNPDWSRVEFARIWVDSIDTFASLSIAEINLAGNEWKLRGVKNAGETEYNTDDETMTTAVINTHDNPEYESPPGVEGVIDPIQKIRSKEQSLVIQLNEPGLGPNASAIAEKQFYQAETLINYKRLKMFVHGGDEFNNFIVDGVETDFPDDGSVEFFLRWGSDTQNEHYYEVRLPVYAGWDERNNIDIAFEDLSQMKVEKQTTFIDTLTYEAILENGHIVRGDTVFATMENGHTVSIVGEPSLTNTRWLIVGIRNNSEGTFSGQIWIDELRVSEVRKDKGMAMRARADIKIADFMTLNGEYNRKDADFHTVNERFGRGSNSEGGNVNASINLEKFMPTAWGLAIPVSANYSKSVQTPKYMPGSDILVTKNTMPDSVLETIQTKNEQMGLNVSFSKRTKSRNFWVRYLVDPIRSSFNYSRADMSSSQIKYSSNVNFKGAFSYDLNFGNNYYWQPFKWMGTTGFFKKLAESKFYYLPTRFSFKMNGAKTEKDSETRSGVRSPVLTKNYTQNITTSIKPFSILSFDLNRSQQSDMRGTPWTDILSSSSPGIPLSKTQQFGTSLNPKIFTWLTHSVKYSANYRWTDNPQMRSKGTGQSSSISTSFTISGNFNPKKFVDSFKKSQRRSTPTRRRRQPVTRQRPTQAAAGEEKEEEEKEKKPFPLITALSYLGKVFSQIDPISISLRKSGNANNYGIQDEPVTAYQLGFTTDPGVDISENVTQRSSAKEDYSLSLGSGFRITSQLVIKLDYQFSKSDNRSTQVTGTVNRSTLLLNDKGIPFPNWSVTWRGLEKLPFIKKVARSITINHSFSGKLTETWNETPDNITQETINKDFRPLIGLAITLNNGLTANMQFAKTLSLSEQKKYGSGRTKRESSNINVTANYALKGGFKIPFLKGKKLDNAIDFSLTFTSSVNSSSQTRATDGEYTLMSETKNWSFQPRINYSFTRTVRGGMYLELGEREDLRAGKTKITGFGINATISLNG